MSDTWDELPAEPVVIEQTHEARDYGRCSWPLPASENGNGGVAHLFAKPPCGRPHWRPAVQPKTKANWSANPVTQPPCSVRQVHGAEQTLGLVYESRGNSDRLVQSVGDSDECGRRCYIVAGRTGCPAPDKKYATSTIAHVS